MGGGSSNGLSDAYDSPGNVLGLMGTADSRPEYKLPPLHSRRRHHQHFRRRHRSPPVDNVVEDDTDVQKPAALQRTPPYDAQYLMHSPQFHPHQHLSPSYPPPNYHGVSRMDDQAPDTGLSASLLQLGLDTPHRHALPLATPPPLDSDMAIPSYSSTFDVRPNSDQPHPVLFTYTTGDQYSFRGAGTKPRSSSFQDNTSFSRTQFTYSPFMTKTTTSISSIPTQRSPPHQQHHPYRRSSVTPISAAQRNQGRLYGGYVLICTHSPSPSPGDRSTMPRALPVPTTPGSPRVHTIPLPPMHQRSAPFPAPAKILPPAPGTQGIVLVPPVIHSYLARGGSVWVRGPDGRRRRAWRAASPPTPTSHVLPLTEITLQQEVDV